MYVVDVIPFSPGAPAGSLTYRTAKVLTLGDIVTVTLRRRKVPAVVVSVEEVADAKASLKAASFSISGSISGATSALPPSVMTAVAKTAEWHAAPLGSVLAQLIGVWMPEVTPARDPGIFTTDSIEAPLGERAARYRSLISESIERDNAVLFVVSTLAEVEYWKKKLADLEPLVLTGSLTEKKRAEAILAAGSSKGLVIATPSFSFAQIERLGRIIIERAGAGGFRLLKRPYIDIRVALFELAKARGLTITYGDFPLPLELRSGDRRLEGVERPPQILDTRKDETSEEAWAAVPKKLESLIKSEIELGGCVAVLAVRKGYAPVVICRDCGQALRDERGKVFAFTQEGGKRLFRTADGKSELSTKRNCPNCGSWNLLPLGVGVERVEEELRQLFPETAIISFDADGVRTTVGAKKKLQPLVEVGGIIVGTEAMVPWLLAASPAPLSLAIIASADSLLALPFWRARERFLRLGLLLPSLAPTSAVGTRLPEDSVMKTLGAPADPTFFTEESVLRKALGYPPFGTLISLTWEGTSAALDKIEEIVNTALGSVTARSIPDRVVRGAVSRRTKVLSLPEHAWPDPQLSRSLSALPPSVRVLIDPESFW